jgi:secretion/DNA translocation related TadE-like protein
VPSYIRGAPHRARDRGAGSILAVALLGAILALTALALPLYLVLATRQSVAAAADAAALAAADVRVGIMPGYPCETAAVVAAANGAHLDGCRLDGLVATTSVSRGVLGLSVTATSTAGPPPGVVD